VDVETGRVKDVLSMPMVALGERGKDGRFRVTVLDAQAKQQPRFVRTGLQDGTRVQVLEGLKLGDTVLTAPPSAEEAAKADAAASAASASKATK
jgi:macrolide-specific efflux system membrane fusion protein